MEYKDLARAGLDALLPKIEVFSNQFIDYEIAIYIPEFTSICPKTSQPDFGKLAIIYIPDKWCIELKSLKEYIHSYRNLGIFYENAVNKILDDFVREVKPKKARVKAKFNSRGGIVSVITVWYPREIKETN
ncbi:MAG: preQ(1) synthase [bacterium]|nr:preQ(1) synthase [bacterium]